MDSPINGFKPVRVTSILQHPDHNDVGIVLEDEKSDRLALLLNRETAEQLHSALLQWLPQGDGEQFGMILATDLVAVEQIDHVAVTSHQKRSSQSRYELDFQIGEKSRFKLQLSWSEAVRMMHRLRAQIAERMRKETN